MFSKLLLAGAAISADAQLNPRFWPRPQQNSLQSSAGQLPTSCPNGRPRADVELPSPLPSDLKTALDGLWSLLNSTVDPAYPAVSGKPQAAAMQIDYRGQKLTSAFVGDKDPKTKAGPPDASTIFRIGSVSKIFPVLMMYQLHDRGVVESLDDPLSKYAPDFEYANVFSKSKKHQFTLRQLASQLSGMQRELPCFMFDCHLDTKEILKRLKTSPGAQFQEFTQPSYSNAAYALLGNILADYVKMPFAEYVQKNILEPLGMHNTGFVYTDDVQKRMAKPYTGSTFIPNSDIGYNGPAGQMYSNVEDLMVLGRYYLGIAGEIFDDGLRMELLTPGFIWRDGSFLQGSPWETQRLEGNWEMLAKGGNVPGHSTGFAIIPALNLTFAALWTGAFDETTTMAKAFEHFLPQFTDALFKQQPPPALPALEPSLYVGDYEATVTGLGHMVMSIVYEKLPGGAYGIAVKENGVVTGWLNFHDSTKAQAVLVGMGDFPANCFMEMAGANVNSWFVFDVQKSWGGYGKEKVYSFEMPGALYGVKFQKTRMEVEMNETTALV